MTDITEGIVIGAVSGVIAGVIVSVLLWIKHGIDIRWNRGKEIKHLRDIIEDFRSQIYTAKGFDFKGAKYTVEVVRRKRFDDMARQLYNALDSGSANLTYAETQGIRDTIFLYTDLYRDAFSSDESDERILLMDFETYNQIFSNLEKLKWLKLSARTE